MVCEKLRHAISKGRSYKTRPLTISLKKSLIQYTRYASVYLAKYKIRVNSISPGAFPNKKVQNNKIFIKKLKSNVPLNRIGVPNDLDTSIIFLSTSNSSYITGINLLVDGGWTTW